MLRPEVANNNTVEIMHIHDLNPWRTLIALSAFVVLLIVGFFTMRKPLLSYEKNINESIAEVVESDAYFYPWELEEFIANKPDTIVLFDIRNRFLFGQGHIPGAENLSVNDLSKKENIDRLKKLQEMGVTVVLCGENELQANGPWMLFRQVGFDNIKLLLGGYSYYYEKKDDLYSTIDDDKYFKEFPKYNFVEMAAPKNGSDAFSGADKQPVEVQRRQKTNVAAGGC